MALEDYGALLGLGPAAPDYATMMLQRQLGGAQIEGLRSEARAREFATTKAQQEAARLQEYIAAARDGIGRPASGTIFVPRDPGPLTDPTSGIAGSMAQEVTPPQSQGMSTSQTVAMMLRFPEFAGKIKEAHELQDAETKGNQLRTMGGVYAAARSGKYDLAAKMWRQRIDADKAAGVDTTLDEGILADLESGDAARQRHAVDALGTTIATLNPEKFAETYGKVVPTTEFRDRAPGEETVAIDPITGEQRVIGTSAYKPTLERGPNDELIEYSAGQPGGGGQASSGGGSITAANNFGAIRDGKFARSQPGYKGRTANGFAVFATATQGTAAQEKLLRTAYIGKGVDTPTRVVNRYAPAGDNNSAASRSNYIGHISRRLGIGPNDKIPADKVPLLATAMQEFERGTWQGGGQGGGVRVVAAGKPKTPSETRVVPGKGTFYKIDGRWYDNPEGA